MVQRRTASARCATWRFMGISSGEVGYIRFEAGTRIVITIVIVFLLNVQLAIADQSRTERTAGAIRDFNSGDIQTAVSEFNEIASAPTSTVLDQISTRLLLAQVCEQILDYTCLAGNKAQLDSLLSQLTDENVQEAMRLQIIPSEMRQLVWNFNQPKLDMRKIFNNINHIRFGAIYPEQYLTLQASEIDYFVVVGDLVDARRAIARLVARAVVLPDNNYSLPNYLAAIAAGMYAVGDRYHAFALCLKVRCVHSNSASPE